MADPDHADLDLPLLALFAGWSMASSVEQRLATDGFDDLRFADGFLFQHVIPGPISITELAHRLGVSQQAGSKAVADLERRGYVDVQPDKLDRRARLVALSARGHAAVAAARAQRADIQRELSEQLGPRRIATTMRTLAGIIDALGGAESIRRRRVRPPS